MTLFYVVSRQPISGKLLNERGEVLARLLRYIVNFPAQGLEHVIDRVLPVKMLPHIDAGRVQAKTMAGIRVEENGPVVKLLPEHDEGVGYGLFTVSHGNTVPLSDRCPPTEHYLIEGAGWLNAIRVPGARRSETSCRLSRKQTLPANQSTAPDVKTPGLE